MTCPICLKNYADINNSQSVCKTHEGWFITNCRQCGALGFSDCVGFCMKCAKFEAVIHTGKPKDPANYLKIIGQESIRREEW